MLKEEILERLKKKTIIDKNTLCWLWQGSRQYPEKGYGVIRLSKPGPKYYVHRLSAHIFHNLDLESKELVCHQMECSNKHCWNPNHIYIGNHQTNHLDEMIWGKRIRNEKGQLRNPTNDEVD